MCATTKNAPKLASLRENPAVALTIDTGVHPPRILLIRGRAELDFVDAIPDEYLQPTSSYEMTPSNGSNHQPYYGALKPLLEDHARLLAKAIGNRRPFASAVTTNRLMISPRTRPRSGCRGPCARTGPRPRAPRPRW